MATSIPRLPKRSVSEAAARREYAAAVLAGLYASIGRAVMNSSDADYAQSLRAARKVALNQADEMLRGEGDV